MLTLSAEIHGMDVAFSELFYCKRTSVFTAYWQGSTSKYIPWAVTHFAQRSVNIFVTAFSAFITFFYVFNILKSSSPLGRFYFLKQPEVIRNQIRCVPFHSIFWSKTTWQKAPCELEHCHGRDSNRWTKIQVFLYVQLQVTTSVFPHKSLVYLWNEFTVKSTLDIKESDEQCLYLWFRHQSF
jgi:hypothetical protein